MELRPCPFCGDPATHSDDVSIEYGCGSVFFTVSKTRTRTTECYVAQLDVETGKVVELEARLARANEIWSYFSKDLVKSPWTEEMSELLKEADDA